MRYISLRDAKPGMQLAAEIYDAQGRTLVGTNMVLTTNYIDRLIEYGYAGIYIKDELTEDVEVESAISPVLRSKGLECLRNKDIDGCLDVAKQLVKEILSKGKISLDMMDLRSFDDYTYAHSVNVAVIAGVLGLGFSMGEEELGQLVTAALLHDIGKLSIPGDILNKPTRLSKEEYKRMQEHSTISYELIKDRIDLSAQIKVAVLFHHENVDGTGYPNGTTGDDQTLFTKILHVADVYDALTSKRPYKEPYAPAEAAEYMMGGCGAMFDQEVVDVLVQTFPLYPKGSTISLSDGNQAVVIENTARNNLRPKVRLFNGVTLDLALRENLSIAIVPDSYKSKVPLEYEQERKHMLGLDERHIVVVDDMKTNLQALYDILKNEYKVTLITSGRQLLKQMQKGLKPDLILMDVDMPEMTGIEAAERVNQMTDHKVPILFVSALCDVKTILACKSLEVEGYVARPYKPVYICSEIERILNRWDV